MRKIRLLVVLVFLGLSAPLAVAQTTTYTGEEYQALYEYAVANTLPNLHAPNGRYPITGDSTFDDRIWLQALERGYVARPTAGGDLTSVGGVVMQPQAADAWAALRAEARRAGLGFTVSSAYRSPETQRAQFLSQLEGSSEAAIDDALTWYSIPGTSKHHSGYALDFRYANGTFGEFRATPAYAWLSADNFAVPRSFGLVPSYPDDVEAQGPNPEPWEFVWVGEGLIACGLPQDTTVAVSGPASALVGDIAHCPGGFAPATVPSWLTSVTP